MGRGVAIALVRDFTDEVTRHVLLAGPRVRSALTSPMHPDSAMSERRSPQRCPGHVCRTMKRCLISNEVSRWKSR
jgi:hypothetical protein